MNRLSIPVVLVFWLVAAPFAPAQGGGKKIALVVGVNKYHHSGLDKLEFAENDVAELGQLLEESGYDVKPLTGENATLEAIRKNLDALRKKPGANGIFLVALAGHGIQPTGGADAYYCPFDAGQRVVPKNDPNQDPWDYKTLLPLTEVVAVLKAASAGSRLLLVDACRNDPTSGRGRGVGTGLQVGDLPENTAVLLSCSRGQRAYEDKAWGSGHGAFFHQVLLGMKGKALDDGKVTADSLWKHVNKAVPEEVSLVIKGGAQQKPFRLITGEVDLRLGKVKQGEELIEFKAGGKTFKLELVKIEGGEFMMGSSAEELAETKKRFDREPKDEKEHKVEVSTFYMGKYAVTRGQFRMFVEDEGYKTDAEKDGTGGWGYNSAKNDLEHDPKYSWRDCGFTQTDSHPVVNVSWNDGKAFYEWLGRKGGRKVRLPTEAEWEYACRAGSKTLYFTGNDPKSLKGYANVKDQSLKAKKIEFLEKFPYFDFDDGYAFTSPVGSFKSNRLGLYDMTGNVWQWCEDGYREDYEGLPRKDPIEKQSNDRRVLRGGSWYLSPVNCRSADRNSIAPVDRDSNNGFRVVALP
jgi:formylglycine-generating enzyme required for sulfatase activity